MAPSGDGTVPWRELLHETEEQLCRAGVPNHASEARWLIEEASGNDGADYLAGLDRPATVRGVAHLDAMTARRLAGEPIQYVLGHWAFRSLDLMVDSRVLIPRPETEGLVTVALTELARQRNGAPLVAVDLGTGSGAVAFSIVVEADDAHVVAVERSAEALAVAGANLAGLGLPARRVRLLHGSWYEPLAGNEARFNLVVSNPPYVATDEQLPESVRVWEPAEALLAGEDGLDAARVIVTGAPHWLTRGGALVMELGADQLDSVASLAERSGLVDVEVIHDLAGLPRILVARKE
jgi:release factor glutamine methyltransferase